MLGSRSDALVRILDLCGRAERCVQRPRPPSVASLTSPNPTPCPRADFVQDLYIKELKSYKAPAPVRALFLALHMLRAHPPLTRCCRPRTPTSAS